MYVELHAHSNLSFLQAPSNPEWLAKRAAALGLPALALTDNDNLSGAVRFSQAAREYGLRPIFGAALTLHDGHQLLLLAKNETGWANLCTLITLGQHNAPKDESRLPEGALEKHTEGLIALSAGRQGVITDALLHDDESAALEAALYYKRLFGSENFWIELQNHARKDDLVLIRRLVALAEQVGVGYVATNSVLYASENERTLQQIMTCIKAKITLADYRRISLFSNEFYLKCEQEMAALFADFPKAITNTEVIAAQCQFDLKSGIQELPEYPLPEGLTALEYLRQLCLKGIPRRYPNANEVDLQGLHTRLNKELDIIARTYSENYYLIVWDLCEFARRRGIGFNARGSGAGSMVAYLLSISAVDPLQSDLLFERFLNLKRKTPGDFDIDFESKRRDEIIQYVYGRYGLEHAALVATLITFKQRSAFRDVAKVFGVPHDAIAALRNNMDDETTLNLDNEPTKNVTWKYLVDHAGRLYGVTRHLGQHNGGMVLTKKPIFHYVPTEPTRGDGRYVVQWDKDSVADLGWVKIDILGLRMLDVISDTLRLIEQSTGVKLDFESLQYNDPRVYAMITLADTVGVFQLDSRAQSQNLPFLDPKNIRDLEISISLIRPGPIMAGTVHAFFARKLGLEPVTYWHPCLESILKDSLGVILWQDQIAMVAEALAGFPLEDGEQMRRDLAKEYAVEAHQRWEKAFIAACVERDVTEEVARQVFAQFQAFKGYSFPHAHAAAFAVLVYKSAYLKCYYPAEYGAALLNNMPVGFWQPGVVYDDLKRRGIEMLSVDINRSQAECSVENGAVRLGFNYIHRLGETGGEKIVTARGDKPFLSLSDFYRRTHLPEAQIQNLIACGAMHTWGACRDLDWQLDTVIERELKNPLGLIFDDDVELEPMTRAQTLAAEVSVIGFSTTDHVMALYRDWLNTRAVTTSEQLRNRKNGTRVRIAGMTIVLQRPPTAKGVAFLTLQDEFGYFMDVIISEKLFKQYERDLKKLLLAVEGTVQRRGNVINVIATRIYDLEARAAAV